MKRFVSTALTMVLLASSIIGCNSASPSPAPSSSASSSSSSGGASTASKVNAYGWTVPEKTLVIDIYAGQGDPTEAEEEQKIMNDFLLEKFNVKINKILYDMDANERLNLMLVSNDYPGIIMGLGAMTVDRWASLGKLQEISGLVKAQPNLYDRFGPYMPRYMTDDGKLYQLATGYGGIDPDNFIPIADTSPMIRQDWYEEIGSPDISTPDAYFDAIKKIVEKHPTTEKGDKVYGLATYKSGNGLSIMLNTHVGAMFGLISGYDIGSDNSVTHWVNSDKGLATVRYINRFVREGLFDPDSLTMTVDEWSERGTNQQYAAYLGPWFQPGYYISDNWYKQMGDAYQENMRYVHYLVKDPSVEHAYYNPKSTMGWGRVVFTDKLKNIEDVMKWLDFEATDNGIRLMGYGVPNLPESVWSFDEATGKSEYVQKYVEQISAPRSTFDYDSYFKIGGDNVLSIAITTDSMADGKSCWINQSFKDKWKELKDERLVDTFIDWTAFSSISIQPDNPMTDVRLRCIDILSSGWAKAIFAKSDAELVSIMDETRQQANAAGLKDLEKYYEEQFKANLAKFNQK